MRTGKIDSGNPVKSITYLNKKKWEAVVNDINGLITDVVNYNDAIKACDKSYNEGRLKAIDDIIGILNSLGFPKSRNKEGICIIKKNSIETMLQTQKDLILGQLK